jgi:hypothetical protein
LRARLDHAETRIAPERWRTGRNPAMRFAGVKTVEQQEYHDAASGSADPDAPAHAALQ